MNRLIQLYFDYRSTVLSPNGHTAVIQGDAASILAVKNFLSDDPDRVRSMRMSDELGQTLTDSEVQRIKTQERINQWV